jgi:hypothetical protein
MMLLHDDTATVTGPVLERQLEAVRVIAAGPLAVVFGPASMMWHVNREAVVFLCAGRALLLRLAHAWVAAAVAEHSRVLAEPLVRFQRIFDVVFALVFGTLEGARGQPRAPRAGASAPWSGWTRIRGVGGLPDAAAGRRLLVPVWACAAMTYWRLPVVFATGALLACAAERADLRVPTEVAAPSPEAWRVAARELAATIVADPVARELSQPVILDPIQGSAPSYFRDLLLAEFIGRAVKIAEGGESPFHVACRTTPIGALPLTRGFTTTPAALPSAEIFILCLLARDGVYVASAQHSLFVPTSVQVPAGAVVIEVKG